MPCTTILVGKNATYDGSTMMARNEDSGSGNYDPKKFIVVLPEEQPGHYKSVISGVEIDLPENPMRYTAMPNALPDEGIWGECGFNTCNVAMSATETITSNARVLGADPLVKGGIGEEDLVTIVLPYIHSAREGVLRLGSLLETYGTYEMNGIGFQDTEEIWWLESIGGHHWMAKRVPDECYVVMPNQLGIDSFDFADAYGEKKSHLCSADLAEFVEKYHLNLTGNQNEICKITDFDARAAFGSHSDSDHVYNTPRAWFMERYLNPKTFKWDGEDADYTPESDDIPWSLVPEKKITVEDIKYVLSGYYQGTPYDPYGRKMKVDQKGKYRTIGINRNNFLGLTQLRPYLPAEIAAVEWLAEGSNAFNAMVPFYGNINTTPEYLAETDKKVTTENFYWANRIIGALADAHYGETANIIERYQNKVAALGEEHLLSCDREYLEKKPECVTEYLERCNDRMADILKNETYTVLDQVLYTASNGMKNAFSRSDA